MLEKRFELKKNNTNVKTEITAGILFLISMFFAPVFTAIPSFATAPAYLCILAMPLFYSISEGIAIGIISYVVFNTICGKVKNVTPLMYILAILFVLKYSFL